MPPVADHAGVKHYSVVVVVRDNDNGGAIGMMMVVVPLKQRAGGLG